MYFLGLFVFFPRVFLSSRVTGACPVTTDLIMRVNVRTTTTISFFFLTADKLSQLDKTSHERLREKVNVNFSFSVMLLVPRHVS